MKVVLGWMISNALNVSPAHSRVKITAFLAWSTASPAIVLTHAHSVHSAINLILRFVCWFVGRMKYCGMVCVYVMGGVFCCRMGHVWHVWRVPTKTIILASPVLGTVWYVWMGFPASNALMVMYGRGNVFRLLLFAVRMKHW